MFRRWFSKLDARYARICAYASVTAILTFIAGLIVWHSWGFFGALWNFFCLAFQPLVYGSMLCYLLQPSVRFFSRVLARRSGLADQEQKRVHLAVILTVAAFVVVLVLIVVFALLVITQSLGGLSFDNLSNILSGAQGGVKEFAATITKKLATFGIELPSMENIAGFMGDASIIVTTIMLSAVFAVYFLFDGDGAATFFSRLLRAVMGEKASRGITSLLKDADRVFSGYVRGQFIDAIAVGALMTVFLMIAGVPYAAFIGIIAGTANLIPFAGGLVGYVLVIVACLSEGMMSKLIWGVIVVTVVMFIDGNYISPRLLANTLTFHPMLVFVALTLGGTVGGPAGMLVAVPLFAFLKQKLDDWIDARLAERELVEGGTDVKEDESVLG